MGNAGRGENVNKKEELKMRTFALTALWLNYAFMWLGFFLMPVKDFLAIGLFTLINFVFGFLLAQLAKKGKIK
jgi:hypothetical protein